MKLFRGIKSCLGSIVSGLILLGAAYGGWRWGDVVFPWLEEAVEGVGVDFGGDGAVAIPGSPEIGERAAARLVELRQGADGSEVSFDAAEVTSLLRYTYADDVPSVIQQPRVRIEDGRVTLLGSVAVADVPSFPDLGEVMSLLPDTVELSARGTLIPQDGPGAALLVDRMEAGGIPLPRRVVPGILNALGREEGEGLPEDAIQVPLPSGVESAFVDGDVLRLRSGG